MDLDLKMEKVFLPRLSLSLLLPALVQVHRIDVEKDSLSLKVRR